MTKKTVAKSKIDNKPETKKRGNPAWKKGGPSPNPAGAPKRGQSWTETIKEISDMTPDEARAMSEKIFAQVRLGNAITLRQAVVLRVFAGLLFEPSPGNFRELMDRADGPVKHTTRIETWQDEIIAALQRGDITADEVVKELGNDGARAILIAAQSIDLSGSTTPEEDDSGAADQ